MARKIGIPPVVYIPGIKTGIAPGADRTSMETWAMFHGHDTPHGG